MFDDLNSRAHRDNIGRTPSQPPRDADALTDREVPLDSNTRISSAMHAWLDGDASEASLSLSDAATEKQVELWKRISADATTRRQVTTPVYVQQRIMAALPQATPARALPFWRRTMSMNPVLIAAASAALVAARAPLGATIFAR